MKFWLIHLLPTQSNLSELSVGLTVRETYQVDPFEEFPRHGEVGDMVNLPATFIGLMFVLFSTHTHTHMQVHAYHVWTFHETCLFVPKISKRTYKQTIWIHCQSFVLQNDFCVNRRYHKPWMCGQPRDFFFASAKGTLDLDVGKQEAILVDTVDG